MAERLAAARALSRVATVADRPVLESRRRSEAAPWVRSALERALIAISVRDATTAEPDGAASVDSESESAALTNEAIYASAVQEVSERLVHELRKVVGRVRFFASEEIADPDSRTVANLNRLQELLDGVQALGDAASVAAEEELDLAVLVVGEVEASGGEAGIRVDALGPSPSQVVGDPALLRLVVSNGLKNAVEAASSVGSEAPVIVTWGATDIDYWLAILDRGPGVPDTTEALFEIGESTKRGHSGMGLAIARRAARSLGGDLLLENDREGMTRFELRWPRRAAE